MTAKKTSPKVKEYRAVVGLAWPDPKGEERRANPGDRVKENELPDSALEHYLSRGYLKEAK